MKTILTTTLIGLLLVAIIGLATQNFCLSWQMDDLERQADTIFAEGKKAGYGYIKSVEELQAQVGARVDGKVSPDWRNSETQEKIEVAYGQQCANVQINRKSMGLESLR